MDLSFDAIRIGQVYLFSFGGTRRDYAVHHVSASEVTLRMVLRGNATKSETKLSRARWDEYVKTGIVSLR